MEILFGDKVLCQDGKDAGEVAKVVVDAETREVTHLVAGKRQAAGQERIIPLSMVQGKTESGLLLYASEAQLGALPTLAQAAFAVPGLEAEEQQAAAAETSGPPRQGGQAGGKPESQAMALRHVSIPLGRECAVRAVDGPLGSLAGIRLDTYTNKLTSIVVASGGLFQNKVDVPATWVAELSPAQIKLATTVDQASRLIGAEAGPYLAVEGEEQADEGGAR